MKYKNYIFDQGNVVLDIDADLSYKAFMELLPAKPDGLPISVADLMGGSEGALVCDYQVGKITTEQFVDSMKKVMKPGVTGEQIVAAWNAMIVEFPKRRLDMLLELRRKGAKVYMLSNTNDAHMEHIIKKCFGGERSKMMEYFDDLFLSNEMGLAKPGLEIYEEMIRRTGMNPKESVYFDDLEQNVEAGKRAGLNAELVNRDEWMEKI